MTQIVNETLKFTNEVSEISRKEHITSEKTEEYLKQILESKKKWNKEVEELQTRVREIPNPLVQQEGQSETVKSESKVFVKTDLNYKGSKKET